MKDKLHDCIEQIYGFEQLVDAMKYCTQFLQNYDPRGYNSKVEIEYDMTEGEWVVITTRWRSCD